MKKLLLLIVITLLTSCAKTVYVDSTGKAIEPTYLQGTKIVDSTGFQYGVYKYYDKENNVIIYTTDRGNITCVKMTDK